MGLQVIPTGLSRHPEDGERPVLVRVLGVGAQVDLSRKPCVLLLEGVGDMLEEDEAEDDVLVLGSVHRAAQSVGHLPELCLVADGRAALAAGRHALLCLGHISPRCYAAPTALIDAADVDTRSEGMSAYRLPDTLSLLGDGGCGRKSEAGC